MCEFCKEIALTDEEFEEMVKIRNDFIFTEDNKFKIYTDTGDSFCPGVLRDINYCPICGRDLRVENAKDR